jgi:hypothetical protein
VGKIPGDEVRCPGGNGGEQYWHVLFGKLHGLESRVCLVIGGRLDDEYRRQQFLKVLSLTAFSKVPSCLLRSVGRGEKPRFR